MPDSICDLADSEIWVFHGDADTAVPVDSNIAAVEALENCGSVSVLLSVYEGVDHAGTWPLAYAESGFV